MTMTTLTNTIPGHTTRASPSMHHVCPSCGPDHTTRSSSPPPTVACRVMQPLRPARRLPLGRHVRAQVANDEAPAPSLHRHQKRHSIQVFLRGPDVAALDATLRSFTTAASADPEKQLRPLLLPALLREGSPEPQPQPRSREGSVEPQLPGRYPSDRLPRRCRSTSPPVSNTPSDGRTPSPPSLSSLLSSLASAFVSVRRSIFGERRLHPNHPPIVQFTDHDLVHRPREVYEEALDKHGPIIAVHRRGNLEFVVDRTLVERVLKEDALFSFEYGSARILNLRNFLDVHRTLFSDLDTLVLDGIKPRLPTISRQIFPVFVEAAREAVKTSGGVAEIDLHKHVHETIAKAMIMLIFGAAYLTPELVHAVEELALDMATLTGMYQWRSWWGRNFPRTWSFLQWLRFVAVSVCFKFLTKLAPLALREVREMVAARDWEHKWNPDEERSLLGYMVKRRMKESGGADLRYKDMLKILSLLIGLIFASVHQTAAVIIWIVFELARRPEYHSALRAEIEEQVDATPDGELVMTYDALERCTKLDSFIREVMRTKGDTIGTMREIRKDTMFEGHFLPAGALITPLICRAHEHTDASNPVFADSGADAFDGFRWLRADPMRPMRAVTSSPQFLGFGYGRWACPGRQLAVAEIKMMAMALLYSATPELEGGMYTVADRMNTTSVPPEGTFYLRPLVEGDSKKEG